MRRLGLALILGAALAPAWAARPVVVVSDCGIWFDDQLALMYLLASPQIELKGIVASQYGSPGSAKLAAESVRSLLKFTGESAPVWLGADQAMSAADRPRDSEGARKIAELAAKGELYVLCLSAATDVAAAILLSGEAVANLRVTWVGGGPLPKGGLGDNNLACDLRAARVLFDSKVPLVWIPATGVADALRLNERTLVERFGSYGAMGREIAAVARGIGSRPATLWDLGAAVLFLRPGLGTMEVRGAPEVKDDFQLPPRKNSKGVTVYTRLRTDAVLQEFEKALKAWAKAQNDHRGDG